MATPEIICQLGFGFPPLTPNEETSPGAADGVDWTDVSADVRGTLSIRRGRNHERNEFEAGTAIVVLNNVDRRFDPNNSSGPHLGDIQPMVKIRIGADWDGDTYWMFTGYVESWTPEYPGGAVSTCTLECVDAFVLFGMRRLAEPSANRAQEVSGDRISALLTAIGWPAAERQIAVGDVDVGETMLQGTVLGVMQETAAVERGSFYVSKAGNAVFEDRSWRDAATSLDTWGDAADGSELPYSEVKIRLDDSMIWNWILITRESGREQAASDPTSQADYFLRTYRSVGLPYVSDADALAAAQWMLARYSEPRTRIERLVIDAGVRDSWAAVLVREISDMITVKRSTLYDGHTATFGVHIEAIEWRIQKGLWECTWQLSPHYNVTPLAGTLQTGDTWIEVDGGIGFENSWGDVGGTAPLASYRKDGEWVTLRGLIDGGTPGTGTGTAFTLPIGYRPKFDLRFPVISGVTATGYGYVLIRQPGYVVVVSGTSTSFDLSPIRFRTV